MKNAAMYDKVSNPQIYQTVILRYRINVSPSVLRISSLEVTASLTISLRVAKVISILIQAATWSGPPSSK